MALNNCFVGTSLVSAIWCREPTVTEVEAMMSKHSELPTMGLKEFTYKHSPTEIQTCFVQISASSYKPHIAAMNTLRSNSTLCVSSTLLVCSAGLINTGDISSCSKYLNYSNIVLWKTLGSVICCNELQICIKVLV